METNFKNKFISLVSLFLLGCILFWSYSAFARRVGNAPIIFGDYQVLQEIVANIAESPEKSLLIFDLDKTLTDLSNKVPQDVIRDILFLMERGINAMIVSGSNVKTIREKILDEMFSMAKDRGVFRRLTIYPNIATEKLIYNGNKKDFVFDSRYIENKFSVIQRHAIEEVLNVLVEKYNQRYKQEHRDVKLTIRIEDGFACIVGNDVEVEKHKDIPDFDVLIEKIEDSLKGLGLVVRGSGRFAIDVTEQNVNKGLAVLDILEAYQYVLSFGDSIVNKAGDWFLYQPKDDVTIPFVYVGYRDGLYDINGRDNVFFATEDYGPQGVTKIIQILVNYLRDSTANLSSDEVRGNF